MLNAGDRFRRAPLVAWILLVVSGIALAAQGGGSESSREQWQKVDAIFQAMDVRPGASVADIGAGDGFLTVRLSAAVGPDGRVHAVDVSDNALDRLRRRVERDQLGNVNIVKGSTTDPRLPEAAGRPNLVLQGSAPLSPAPVAVAFRPLTSLQSVMPDRLVA